MNGVLQVFLAITVGLPLGSLLMKLADLAAARVRSERALAALRELELRQCRNELPPTEPKP